jgi:hypothetical protein
MGKRCQKVLQANSISGIISEGNVKVFASILRKCCMVGILVLLLGCTSMEKKVEDHGNEWISRPLSEMKQAMNNPDTYASKTNWEETTYPLAKGYFIFVEPFNEDCLIHWKINPRGIILSYFPEGNGCGSARGTAHETSQIEDVSPPAK